MKERNGCCHTESTFLKIQDDHQLAKTLKTPQFVTNTVAYTSLTDELSWAVPEKETTTYVDPPDPRLGAVYLHINVFRI